MNEIRLPSSSASPDPRTLTGTIDLRRIGFSPRFLRNARTPPAEAASTTSLSLTPNVRLIRVRSSIGRARRPSWRSGEIGRVELGGRPGRDGPHPEARLRPAEHARRARALGGASVRHGRGSPPGRAGCAPGRSAHARSASSRWGATPGAHASGAGDGATGSGSSSRLPSSTAAIPSTMQWWTLPTTPIRPSSSRSAIQTCHSGRWRGSGFDMHSSTTSPSRSDLEASHMPGNVEIEVVCPHRGVDPERHRLQRLPVPRRPRQPACDVFAKLLEAGPDPIAGRLEYRRPAHVHVSGRRLDRQERGVER